MDEKQRFASDHYELEDAEWVSWIEDLTTANPGYKRHIAALSGDFKSVRMDF